MTLEFSKEELYNLRMIIKEHLLDLDIQIDDALDQDKEELIEYKTTIEKLLLKLNK